MFDRDFEWMQLVSFAADPGPGATLGVVSGRRRQGTQSGTLCADGKQR